VERQKPGMVAGVTLAPELEEQQGYGGRREESKSRGFGFFLCLFSFL
jgi:hypothetical protein